MTAMMLRSARLLPKLHAHRPPHAHTAETGRFWVDGRSIWTGFRTSVRAGEHLTEMRGHRRLLDPPARTSGRNREFGEAQARASRSPGSGAGEALAGQGDDRPTGRWTRAIPAASCLLRPA